MIQNETAALETKPNPVVAIWRNALVQAFFSDTVTLLSGIFLLVIILSAALAPWVVGMLHAQWRNYTGGLWVLVLLEVAAVALIIRPLPRSMANP